MRQGLQRRLVSMARYPMVLPFQPQKPQKPKTDGMSSWADISGSLVPDDLLGEGKEDVTDKRDSWDLLADDEDSSDLVARDDGPAQNPALMPVAQVAPFRVIPQAAPRLTTPAFPPAYVLPALPGAASPLPSMLRTAPAAPLQGLSWRENWEWFTMYPPYGPGSLRRSLDPLPNARRVENARAAYRQLRQAGLLDGVQYQDWL